MKAMWILTASIALGLSAPLFAAEEPNAAQALPDVGTIVSKANVAAYYQGEDGKARVKMTITNKQGKKQYREFIILRKIFLLNY